MLKDYKDLKDNSFVIADWLVKPSSNLLINKNIEKKLEPKVMKLLVFLANAKGEAVSREAILEAVWQQVVQDDALTNVVANLRKALGDTSSPKHYIQTVPKFGYRLIPDVIWKDNALIENESSVLNSPASVNLTKLEKSETSQKSSLLLAFLPSRIVSWLLSIAAILLVIGFIVSEQRKVHLEKTLPSGSVAVLPFDVYSSQADIDFFASGLTEELIHQLAANPELKVIARTSSSKFQGTDKSIKDIAEVLGVKYVIEGSVRENGDSLRVTVQLIEAEEDFHLWSKTFDSNTDESLLDAQISISQKVSTLIANNKSKTEAYNKRNHPNSAQAYRLFLLAQSHMKIGQVEGYEKALAYYQRAIDIAPNYALAYSGMAAAKILLYQYNHTSLEQTNIEATQLLTKALSIEPNLAEAFAVRGLLNTYLQLNKQAETDFLRSIALNPGSRFARHNYGFLLWRQSRSQEAMIQFEIALEMDPLSPITNFSVGDTLGNLGEIEKAIAHYESCRKLLPRYFVCSLGLATIYKLVGNQAEYKRYLSLSAELTEDNNFWQSSITAAYELQVGNLEASRRWFNKASQLNKYDYHNLKVDFNLNLKASTLKDFTSKTIGLATSAPNNLDLNLLLGLSYYFENNCQLSIAQYEKGSAESNQSLLEIWDFAEGISHSLNLAYCYKQRNNASASEQVLKSYNNFVKSMPKSEYKIPGKIYSNARFLALSGKHKQARQALNRISRWSYIWLSDIDPLLKELK